MKTNLRNPFVRSFCLLVILFLSTAMTPLPEIGAAKVTIDDVEVLPDKTMTFKKDDTVYLRATGIKPNSNINFKIKKAGISWSKYDFKVDESGAVEGVLFIPEKKIAVSCFVTFTDAENKFHDVKFKFKVR